MSNKAIKMKDKKGDVFYPCPYYPVGSIYISLNDINPSTFFGGTWTKLESRFLIGSGSATGEAGEPYNFQIGATGGEYSHKLTKSELPNYNLRGPRWNSNNWPITLDGGTYGDGYKLEYQWRCLCIWSRRWFCC